jgi:uncharacterized membrane-anchored protein
MNAIGIIVLIIAAIAVVWLVAQIVKAPNGKEIPYVGYVEDKRK